MYKTKNKDKNNSGLRCLRKKQLLLNSVLMSELPKGYNNPLESDPTDQCLNYIFFHTKQFFTATVLITLTGIQFHNHYLHKKNDLGKTK